MKKEGLFMVGGASVSLIGIIIMLWGYNKDTGIEGASTMLVNGAPPGTGVMIVGILSAVVGGFTLIDGFGLLPEDTIGQ